MRDGDALSWAKLLRLHGAKALLSQPCERNPRKVPNLNGAKPQSMQYRRACPP
jgi:hypothetical protein